MYPEVPPWGLPNPKRILDIPLEWGGGVKERIKWCNPNSVAKLNCTT
jgi:hypothetical protein